MKDDLKELVIYITMSGLITCFTALGIALGIMIAHKILG